MLKGLKSQRINSTASSKGLTSLKGRGTPTAKDLRAERKIEWIDAIDTIDTIDAIEGIEDKYNQEDRCYI